MYKKIVNIFFITIVFFFIFSITKYYFSEENKILINKSRSSYSVFQKKNYSDLPILKKDTSDIIVYINDLSEFKNKRKKRFWEKLISNENE